MKKIFEIIIFLNMTIAFGQSNQEIYRFSRDIISKIEKDTVSWKYQIGAAELSFGNYYKDVLKIWDKNGVKQPITSVEDSLYFVNSQKINAKEYIIEQSKNTKITIINEAHHISKHRVFTKSILQGLYDNGYRYFGLEALFDQSINERKYPIMESGYYTKEPEFGNLISEAINIGFTIFGYEATEGKNNKEREIEQAENIQKFINNNPNGKVLIHCGFAHVYENDYPIWGKAMAGRLKENMKIDPLTIDQTMFLERSDLKNTHLFIKLNKTQSPIVLIDEKAQIFNGKDKTKQTDIVIIHPQTEYIDSRPEWQIKGKEKHTIPTSKILNNKELLILAYRNDEFEKDGIPADSIEITDEKTSKDIYLSKGTYTIVLKNNQYNIIDKYNIEIK